MNAREKIRAFLKGRALPVGTSRRHGGIWKRKQADGSWKPDAGARTGAMNHAPGHTRGHDAGKRESGQGASGGNVSPETAEKVDHLARKISRESKSNEVANKIPEREAKKIRAIYDRVPGTEQEISPDLMYASEQIRKNFNPADHEEMVNSIRSLGLLQSILVRPDGKGRYEIIAGERRFRAIRELIRRGEWKGNVRVSVQDVDDRTKDLMQLAENYDRRDNTTGETADFFKKLMDKHGMTVAEIAEKGGISPQTVRAHLSITELHPDLRKELNRGNLQKTAAQLLGTLNHGQQLRAYSEMLRKNMNTGTFRNYVQALKTQGSFFSDDEIKTDEMKAAGRALGDKSPEKLQQKFQQTLDKHQQFLNKFFDADGSRLSALALAATGDFDRTMERMQLMQNEVERVMREMRTHRDKIKGDEAQEAMFKSVLAEFAGLERDCARLVARCLVLDFLKAKGADIGEIHHWATGDFKKEDHGWSKVKQDIRQHLDRLHKKAHLRDAVVTRNLDELNARHRTYAEVGNMSDAGIVDRFSVSPEKVAVVRQQAAERLKKTATALKRHSRIAEGPGLNSYRPKRDPYDRVREYAAQVEQFLTESYGRHLDRKSEERLAPLRAKLADRAGELKKLQTALAKLDPEKDEDAAGEIDEQIQDIESEVEQFEDRISRISERTASQKADHAGTVSGRMGDLADKSRDSTEADMAGLLEQQQAVLGRGQHNPEAPRGPDRSRLMLTRKKILGRLARPKMKSVVAYRLMRGRAIVRFFLKGRGFPIGTRRQHGGVWKRKQADGSWKPDSGRSGAGEGIKKEKRTRNKRLPAGVENPRTLPEPGVWIDSVPGLPEETWKKYFNVHPGQGGKPVRRRQSLHNRIKKQFLVNTSPVASDSKPEAILMMGGPASGKSSMVKKSGLSTANFVVADADAVKEKFPEYRQAVNARARNAAYMAHEESSYLVKRIRRTAISTRRNLVVDGTGSRLDSCLKTLKDLKASGYHTTLMLADCDFEIALPRAMRRAEKTGRLVPEKVMRESYSGSIPENFLKLKDLVDDFMVFDTRGSENIPIFTRTRGTEKVHDATRFSEFIGRSGQGKGDVKN